MKYAGWDKEIAYQKQKYQSIVGIDEVGRGCWAGPLVSVAYRFFDYPTDIQVGDSKTIPEAKRIILAEQLKTLGDWAIGEVTNQEIDALGLQTAQFLSYERALDGLQTPPDLILLDGRAVSWQPYNSHNIKVEAIIDGDALVASIAAASIIAKVYRDIYMQTVAQIQFPDYGFDQHVGYGTKQHQIALQKFGVTNLHRQSYKPIQKFLDK